MYRILNMRLYDSEMEGMVKQLTEPNSVYSPGRRYLQELEYEIDRVELWVWRGVSAEVRDHLYHAGSTARGQAGRRCIRTIAHGNIR